MRIWKRDLWPGLEAAGYEAVTKYNESGEGVAILWRKAAYAMNATLRQLPFSVPR